MWPFKKKIYKVEYIDKWKNYGYTVVRAYNEAGAWRAARAMYSGPYQPTICVSIIELHNAA